MIAPQALEATEHGWTDSGTEEFVLDLVDGALRTWKIDPDRVYFVGHSMGGYGSWTLGAHHADRVAAVAPSAGAPTPILDRATNKPVDIVEGVIPSLRSVFVSVPDHPGELARLFGDAGEIGVNIEDVHIDHDPGRPVGLTELVVEKGSAERLLAALESRGWTTHR